MDEKDLQCYHNTSSRRLFMVIHPVVVEILSFKTIHLNVLSARGFVRFSHFRMHHLGTINICTTLYANPSSRR